MAAVINGIIAVAGILGTLVAVYLTNKAAERRLAARLKHENGTRFHHLRVELYGKLFTAVLTLRIAIAEARPDFHRLSSEAEVRNFIDGFNLKIGDVIGAAQMVGFIANNATRGAASEIMEAMLSLQMRVWQADHAEWEALHGRLDDALSAFSAAARAELSQSPDTLG